MTIERKNKLKFIFLILVTILLISCSPPKQGPRNRYINDNPGLSGEQKKAIHDGKVIPGMNKTHVLACWASPILKWTVEENDVKYEVWTYPEMLGSPFVNIFFDGDIVEKIVKAQKPPQVE